METDKVENLLAPEEPVLPVADIQGIVVPGFTNPHETLLGVQFGTGHQVTKNFKNFIRKMSNQIATAEQTLEDRRDHRVARRATRTRYPQEAPQRIFIAVAFSYSG